MIRITKLTDYGIVLLSHMAGEGKPHNARDLAAAAELPEPTVGKLLKALTRGGILVSHRGAKGGYTLSRPSNEITVGQVIAALDGPIAITDCSGGEAARCAHELRCPVRSNWQRINLAIRDSLEGITLADMARPAASGGQDVIRLNQLHTKVSFHAGLAPASRDLEPCQSRKLRK
jgi:FeS assembly SUF system regulator